MAKKEKEIKKCSRCGHSLTAHRQCKCDVPDCTCGPALDPNIPLNGAEWEEVYKRIEWTEDDKGNRIGRATTDKEILQWITEKRLVFISLSTENAPLARLTDLYWFNGKTYENCNVLIEKWLREAAKRFDSYLPRFSINLKSSTISDFIVELKQVNYTTMTEVDKDESKYMAFQNLLLDRDSFEHGHWRTFPFDHHLKLIQRIPHNLIVPQNFSTASDEELCPTFYKQFKDTSKNEKWIPLKFQQIGYCFVRGYPIHILFVLYGPHDAGKGTFTHILWTVLGLENYTDKSFQDLVEKVFELQHLYRMLANIGDEMPERLFPYVEVLKKLTGESGSNAPLKHSNKKNQIVNSAKLFFLGNAFGRIKEAEDAWWDRVIVDPYPNRFTENKGYEDRLLSNEKEIEMLIFCSLRAVQKVLEVGKFSIPDEDAKEEWRRISDSVRAFIKVGAETETFAINLKDPNLEIRADMLYEHYQKARIEQSGKPAGEKSFTRRLKQQFGIEVQRKEIAGEWVRFYKGIGWARKHSASSQANTIDS